MRVILAGLGNWAANWNTMRDAVLKAEELGYWGAVMPDHYMWGPQRGGDSTLETWVALSYLAAKTYRIRLGTLVTPICFRPPGILAKMVSTVDLLSGGRAFLGVGAGWSQTEFEGYGQWDPPGVRVSKTKEGLELILRLWTEPSVTFEGKYYHAKNAVLEPKPVQTPHPPLLFGGSGRRMLRLAGQYSDICYIQSGAEMGTKEAKALVAKEADGHGRREKVSFAGGLIIAERGRKYERKSYADQIEAAKAEGCGYFIAPFPRESTVESLVDFGKNVLPSYL